MAIQKNEVITKDDIFEYMLNKDYTTLRSLKISNPGVGKHDSKEVFGNFWIRNDSTLFLSSEWLVGTIYDTKDRVWADDGGDIRVFTSMSDSNVGNDPLLAVDETDWHEVIDGTVITTFYNLKGVGNLTGSIHSAGDYWLYQIWKITWDVSEDPIETLIINQEDDNDESTQTYQYTLEPGYYKYRIEVGSQGARSSSTVTLSEKNGANDMDQSNNIRVFDTNLQALLPVDTTNVTTTLAKSGRLSTVDYVGGDYEVHVP